MKKANQLRYIVNGDYKLAVGRLIKRNNTDTGFWVDIIQIEDGIRYNNFILIKSESGNVNWHERYIGRELYPLEKALL